MSDLARYRRFFAEEIEAVARLRSRHLVEALAAVPRERFLPPGPWTFVTETDYLAGATPGGRATPDADPRRVYHNVAIAIDPGRQLFNGQPATLASWIDALDLEPGARVLHVGAGLGYYTALLGAIVGRDGGVTAFEIDPALAGEARANLASMPWVSLRTADASSTEGEAFDAILVNAGVTHPLDAWLDAMATGGRMILPITATMGSTIGKGLVWRVTRKADAGFDARALGMTSVYSAVGLRDESLNGRIGQAMMAGPAKWQLVTRLRRDAHDPAPSCWLHGPSSCLSSAEPHA